MGTGYTRNDTGNNIADGNVINASDLDGEFDAIQAAFNESTGHTHDGTSAEGAPITKLGPSQNVEVGTGAITPSLDNTVDLGSGSLEFKDLYIDGTANIDSLVADTADINAGTIDNTTIGGSTPAAATVTTLTVNGNTTLGDAATDTVTFTADVASNVIPSADDTYDLGASGSEWKDLYIDGTANIDSLVADTADINGGTIDGVTIGGAAAGVGTFTTANATTVDTTNIEVTNIKAKDGSAAATIADSTGVITVGSSVLTTTDINGGTIDGTTIGGASAAAGTFTTATATTGNITTVNATTVDTTNLEVTTLKAKDGTSAGSIADSTGVVTLASSVLTTTDINGGTVDGVTIGGASAGAGTFTTLTATGNVTLGNAATDTVTITADVASNVIPSADNTYDLGASGSEWKDLYIDGTANIDSLVADTADINGGTIDGATIGGASAAAGSFTTLNTSGAVVFNDAGADVDFRVEGDTDANLLFVDASTDRVGIGTSTPSQKFTVIGDGGGGAVRMQLKNEGNASGDIVEFQLLTTEASAQANIVFGDPADSDVGELQYVHSDNSMRFLTNAAERLRIDSSGNVGIGTSSPTSISATGVTLDLVADGSAHLRVERTNATNPTNGTFAAENGQITLRARSSSTPIVFYTETSSERMRIDSSGNLLVGTTSSIVSDGSGIALQAGGRFVSRYTDSSTFDRRSTNGDILDFQKDGTTVGSIEIQSHGFEINGEALHAGISFATAAWLPKQNGSRIDNVIDLGASSYRFDDVYATNGTIQTSDRNEKQDIEDLSEAETRVAVAAKNLLKKYRWNSAVAEKGDDARIHFGIIAQDLKAAFEAEGLDAGRYAMFIHSEWWETQTEVPAVEAQEAVLDDEGNVVQEAVEGKEAYTRTDTYQTEAEAPEGAVRKERMGIRYNELLAFIIAAL